jgi:hypothetical protein
MRARNRARDRKSETMTGHKARVLVGKPHKGFEDPL